MRNNTRLVQQEDSHPKSSNPTRALWLAVIDQALKDRSIRNLRDAVKNDYFFSDYFVNFVCEKADVNAQAVRAANGIKERP